jgi:2'-5' RNA ligase
MSTHHRLFFAIRPPEATRPYFLEEQVSFGPGHAVRPEHLHLTTAILDDHLAFPQGIAERLQAVGDAIVADQFPIVLDQVAASEHSVVMIPSEPLHSFRAFQQGLAKAMARAGLGPRRGWRFSPHVTLLYRPGAPLRQWTDALSWTVTEFVLIDSLLGLTRHEVLARWPLLAPRPSALA